MEPDRDLSDLRSALDCGPMTGCYAAMPGSPPQVNAFLICDQAFPQAGTRKWCVIGTFGVIWAQRFPVTHAPLVVFIGLSDFEGNCTVTLGIRDTNGAPVALPVKDQDGNQVTEIRMQFQAVPLSVAEFAVPFPPMTFEEAGSYTLELVAGGTILAARSFRVEQAPPPGQVPQAPPGFPTLPTPPGGEPE